MTRLCVTIAVLLCSSLAVHPLAAAGSARGHLGRTILKNTVAVFEEWATRHSMSFNSTERPKRLKIFSENLAKIRLVNLQKRPYTLKLNKFAHLTFEEFKAKYLRYRPSKRTAAKRASHTATVLASSVTVSPQAARPAGRQIPAAIDWRKRGAVTFVKDQGSCGKCVYDSVPQPQSTKQICSFISALCSESSESEMSWDSESDIITPSVILCIHWYATESSALRLRLCGRPRVNMFLRP